MAICGFNDAWANIFYGIVSSTVVKTIARIVIEHKGNGTETVQ